MIKRIVEISSRPLWVTVRDDQLRLSEPPPGTCTGSPSGDSSTGAVRVPGQEVASIPCEDVGVLLIEHQQAMISHAALTRLMEYGAAVVFCGRDHLPVGVAHPVSRNVQVVQRLHTQIEAGKPIQKQLWKQLVVAKIRAQARNLRHAPKARARLLAMARRVRSDDPQNLEAQAARAYWAAWLHPGTCTGSPPCNSRAEAVRVPGQKNFRRDTGGGGINGLLNYGYAVVRAAVGRALVSAGLNPALGIHHHHRSNAFALADDLLEPLRPLVDATVQQLVRDGEEEVTPQTKKALLGILHKAVSFDGEVGPLMVVMHRYAAAFVRCLEGGQKTLPIPTAADEDGEQ